MILKRNKISKKTNRLNKRGKRFMMVVQKKHVVLVALAIMILIAGYLNWAYRKEMNSLPTMTAQEDELAQKKLGEAQLVHNNLDGSAQQDENSHQENQESKSDEVVADVDADNDNRYFVEAKMDKESARSEALDILKSIVEDEKSPVDSKTKAQNEMVAIAKAIDQEAIVENLLKAKGFQEVVVFINEGNVNVVVKAEGELVPAQVAQIQDVVISQTNVSADKIKIVPVK